MARDTFWVNQVDVNEEFNRLKRLNGFNKDAFVSPVLLFIIQKEVKT